MDNNWKKVHFDTEKGCFKFADAHWDRVFFIEHLDLPEPWEKKGWYVLIKSPNDVAVTTKY
jgi:hypothetical protein